jgi:hypothetical protein
MTKRILIVAGLALAGPLTSQAAVTFNVGAEVLKTAGGTAMPTTGLVLLEATGTDMTFNGPTASLFASGDDHVVYAWDLSLNSTPGLLLSSTPSEDFSGTWGSGQPLGLYWFPDSTLVSYNNGAGSPGANKSYGFFTDSVGHNGGAAWVTPLSGTVSLNFYTSDATILPSPAGSGYFDASVGKASLTTVPEPSAYMVAFGFLSLAGAAARRFLK